MDEGFGSYGQVTTDPLQTIQQGLANFISTLGTAASNFVSGGAITGQPAPVATPAPTFGGIGIGTLAVIGIAAYLIFKPKRR